MTFLLNLITAAVLYGTPLLYGTSGEILTGEVGQPEPGRRGHDVDCAYAGFMVGYQTDNLLRRC